MKEEYLLMVTVKALPQSVQSARGLEARKALETRQVVVIDGRGWDLPGILMLELALSEHKHSRASLIVKCGVGPQPSRRRTTPVGVKF